MYVHRMNLVGQKKLLIPHLPRCSDLFSLPPPAFSLKGGTTIPKVAGTRKCKFPAPAVCFLEGGANDPRGGGCIVSPENVPGLVPKQKSLSGVIDLFLGPPPPSRLKEGL